MVPYERSCHKEYTCAIWKPYYFWFESYGQGYSFSKVGQTSRSRSQGQNLWYHVKGLVIRNRHMKYESSIFNGLKVMAKVKVFVHAAKADTDGRAMTISSLDIRPGLLKIALRYVQDFYNCWTHNVKPRSNCVRENRRFLSTASPGKLCFQ